jgi:hypothetical protein
VTTKFTSTTVPSTTTRTAANDCPCTQLGWEPGYGSPAVCAYTACSGPITWSEASTFCEDYFGSGARLCTADELRGDEAKETGCDYDTELVWSSTLCSTKESEWGHVQALGAFADYGE